MIDDKYWKDITGYEGLYKISQCGEIFSVRRNHIISPFLASGYNEIVLSKNGVRKKWLVHRIVAGEFIVNEKGLPCVNHIDGNKLNNCVDNLEWCTYKENMKHAIETGLYKVWGSDNPASKLLEDEVRYIQGVYKKGDKKFSAAALGRMFGVDPKTIWNIVNNRTWRTVV